jgi:regulator of cell morphogenesis and NO signaling
MATLTKEMIINDVIRKFPNTMKVFSKFKVDSCCGGGESIDTTAKVGGADVPQLMIELNEEVDNGA